MASDNGNIMDGDKGTAERPIAVSASSYKEQSTAIDDYLMEKPKHGTQLSYEKGLSGSPYDMETGGLRTTVAKKGPLTGFSFKNPSIWPYLGWVSIEVGDVISKYLLLKVCERAYPENSSKGPINLPWPKPEDMSIAFIVLLYQVYILATGLLYYNRQHDRYQKLAILLSILAIVPLCMNDQGAQSWRDMGLMVACMAHFMVAAGLELSAWAHVIGRICRMVWTAVTCEGVNP